MISPPRGSCSPRDCPAASRQSLASPCRTPPGNSVGRNEKEMALSSGISCGSTGEVESTYLSRRCPHHTSPSPIAVVPVADSQRHSKLCRRVWRRVEPYPSGPLRPPKLKVQHPLRRPSFDPRGQTPGTHEASPQERTPCPGDGLHTDNSIHFEPIIMSSVTMDGMESTAAHITVRYQKPGAVME